MYKYTRPPSVLNFLSFCQIKSPVGGFHLLYSCFVKLAIQRPFTGDTENFSTQRSARTSVLKNTQLRSPRPTEFKFRCVAARLLFCGRRSRSCRETLLSGTAGSRAELHNVRLWSVSLRASVMFGSHLPSGSGRYQCVLLQAAGTSAKSTTQ